MAVVVGDIDKWYQLLLHIQMNFLYDGIWEKLRDFDQMIQYLSNYLGVRLIPEWGYDPFVLVDLL